ncbi:major facilitator superfamily transporter [Ceratobasidium sp. AG-Ba]|nr:major facilitator superfamily transporter [Ceratobasidium sp. AG-Ba]
MTLFKSSSGASTETSSTTSIPSDDPEIVQSPPERTPIPKLQLLTVCVSRIAEPLAYSQIFPYVNQMVWELGVTDNPKKVGFYSGIIDSAFAFAQLFTVYSYGSLSDRIGRKPVVLFGTFGVAICAALFGLSSSFIDMVGARTLAGLLSGYVAVLHSVLGEITDATNQANVYPIYSLCYPIGSLIGPLVGGALAQPNENIPHLIPSFLRELFNTYPYLLPSGVAATIATLSFTFVLIFMDETLPSKVRSKLSEIGGSGTSTPSSSYGARGRTSRIGSSRDVSPSTTAVHRSRGSSTSTCVGEDRLPKSLDENEPLLGSDDKPRSWSAWELLKLPHLRQLYASAAMMSFLAESYIVVFVLFCYSNIQDGGLGFDPAAIGFTLATSGGISFALQILALPYLLRRFQPAKIFRICMVAWPICFAIPPVLNIIARISSDNGAHEIGQEATAAIWIGIWFAQVLSKFACMSYAMNMVIARHSAPDQRALGATNGLNQFSLCMARMFAPTVVSTLFALSSDYNLLGGHLVWIIMSSVALVGTRISPADV